MTINWRQFFLKESSCKKKIHKNSYTVNKLCIDYFTILSLTRLTITISLDTGRYSLNAVSLNFMLFHVIIFLINKETVLHFCKRRRWPTRHSWGEMLITACLWGRAFLTFSCSGFWIGSVKTNNRQQFDLSYMQ